MQINRHKISSLIMSVDLAGTKAKIADSAAALIFEKQALCLTNRKYSGGPGLRGAGCRAPIRVWFFDRKEHSLIKLFKVLYYAGAGSGEGTAESTLSVKVLVLFIKKNTKNPNDTPGWVTNVIFKLIT